MFFKLLKVMMTVLDITVHHIKVAQGDQACP